MDRCKILPRVLIVTGCVLSSLLTGCSTDKASQLNNRESAMVGESLISNDIENITESSKNSIYDNGAYDDLKILKAQLERQQQQLETMSAEQQALQEQLKRQQFALTIKPAANANAGRTKQGTASIAYIAFLEEESQFAEIEALAAKEISVIPSREVNLTLAIPPDTQFIAVKVGLRQTKKRSQFLIPIASLTTDAPLAVSVGACDVTITEGMDPERVPAFTTKLKYYQQPLVSCL